MWSKYNIIIYKLLLTNIIANYFANLLENVLSWSKHMSIGYLTIEVIL